MDITQIININAIELRYFAKDKHEIIDHLVDLLVVDNAVSSKEKFLEDVYKRESQGITGIGDAIAIPHGVSNAVIKNCVAVCTCQTPVEWESIDGLPVSLVVLFAVKANDKSTIHLKMMAAVASALADEDFRRNIKNATNTADLVRAFAG